MSTRNLDALFAPRSIVFVGASDRAGSVGDVLAANLVAARFPGELMFVNPRGRTVHGRQVHARIADLPHDPDFAVIATPAPTVPELVSQLGARGCRAVVVISAGFEGDDGDLRQALLDAARPHTLRIVGPNCLGVLSPGGGVNASFARGTPPAGNLALVAQSGAVAAAALDWAPAHGLGFSHVVTLGDSLDVDVGDALAWLADDPGTSAILLYIEALRDAPKFMRAARAAAARKPVIAIKGGRSRSGAKAAFSHTRALAGADAVYSAAFRQAGVLQLDTLEEVLDTAALMARAPGATPGGLTILTNGGGAGVLAVDALEHVGGQLTELSSATQSTLRAIVPAHAACGNPVDILGDAGPDLYARSLAALLAAPEVEAVLAVNCPTAVADSTLAADAVIAATQASASGKPVFGAWIGEVSVAESRRKLTAAGLAAYTTPEEAVRAFARLGQSAALRARVAEIADGPSPAQPAGAAIVARALADGRKALAPDEIQALLQAYGIPILATRTVATAAEAGAAAEAMGGRVALKVLSSQITHKSDVGGVALGLEGADAVRGEAEAMLSRIAQLRPEATVDGFFLQPMVEKPKAVEVLAGLVRDPTFGPVVVVGHGGVAVEVMADRALALPPLDAPLALEAIRRTRVAKLLAGYRDRPAADLDALAAVLGALGQLALDLPEVAELDLNPVLCDADGALALDARVAVGPRQ
ncbi:acetate--CoA ligase family protein [Phenylobacterium kunshanense]|uniref:GNAT family N-acetyltransferase n=1 Tax=Phenylobacterium kunshanense TaxID=1445034 RepID=A0A328B7D5_9CAUL|nr:acetate--CoA ligase [Phenylobacterium kunshanense]RAK62807.1 GNAT family N-acetyltransferase [Phenylobacterium kunshanense]